MVVLGADNSFYSFWKGFKVFHPWFLEFFPVEEIVFYWESYFCRKKNDMHAFNYLVISIFLIGETLTGRISVKGVLKNFRGTCPCRRLCFHTAPRCRHLPRHPLSGIWLYKNIYWNIQKVDSLLKSAGNQHLYWAIYDTGIAIPF